MMKNRLLSRIGDGMISARTMIRWRSTAVNMGFPEAEAAGKPREGGLNLYKRLSALGAKKGLVESTINAYIREGKMAPKDELTRCLRELRRFRRHHQALEIMEWMDSRNMTMSFTDLAIRLDLISKVHNVGAAEKYFNDLRPQQKNKYTYGALLNCYCAKNMKKEALDLFDKMEKMQIEPTQLAFGNLMSLYMRLGEFEKVAPLVEEMKKRQLQLTTFTYNVWMNSCSCLSDIEGVERVFEEIKQEGESKCDWTTYSHLAIAYVREGLKEKAERALEMLEIKMDPKSQEAFQYLLSLNASISNHDEVHRIWKTLKSNVRKVTNVSYLTMLQALRKLNDIDGFKELFEEWESISSSYDIRLANLAIGTYLRHGMVNEAEEVHRGALKRSSGPFYTSWELLMVFYLDNREIQHAMRCLEGATSGLNKSTWRPSSDSISKFLVCLEEEKDVDSAEKLCKLLKKINCLNHNVYRSLLKTYISTGRTEPNMRKRLKGDQIEIDSELEDLLQIVCFK